MDKKTEEEKRVSNRETMKNALRESRLVVIARGMEAAKMIDVAEALYSGGVRVLECTFDHWREDCVAANQRLISALVSRFEGRMQIGAGTVLSDAEAEAAVDAGAGFIISPGADEAVIRATRRLGAVSIPGAYTPTEIVAAWNAGADFVKLFPAGDMGPGYIKAIRAPLAHIPMLAVGSVTRENIPLLLKSGVCGFGIGGSLLSKALIDAEDYEAIRLRAQEYSRLVRGEPAC